MIRLICSALALTVVTGSFPAGAGTSRFQSDATPRQESSNTPPFSTSAKQPVEIPEEDAPEGELEPAALQLDVSSSSPLIEELYRATRETKEKEILAAHRPGKAAGRYVGSEGCRRAGPDCTALGGVRVELQRQAERSGGVRGNCRYADSAGNRHQQRGIRLTHRISR